MRNATSVATLLASLLIPSLSQAQGDQCFNAIQGKIPWNAQGNKQWDPANIEKLCRGGSGDEPARCFDRLMRGQVNWGGGTTWEWANALALCHASRDSSGTIMCFEGQMRAKIPWQQAITNCGPSSAPPQQPPPPRPEDQMSHCTNAVQGKIPWNPQGDTRWSPVNIERLCKNGVRDEPAKCFERLMRGHINWGGGTNWEWENAVNLCHASRDANATLSCFEGQIRAHIAWQQAIPNCAPTGTAEQPPVQVVPVDQLAACRAAVQGKIPWNAAGDTRWAPANVEKLCTGGAGEEPAKCFDRLIRGKVSWGGGTNWEWENAVDLCHGAQDHRRTIACFEEKIRAHIAWKAAITACKR